MRILFTGAFGNVGTAVLQEFQKRNYDVTIFELETKKNQKIAKNLQRRFNFNLIWGDISDKEALIEAAKNVDAIVHLAGIIPPVSEANRDICFKVNLDGTRNIADAIMATGNKAKLVFTSSVSVMGPTQAKTPPISPYDTPVPTSNYTESKIEAEKLIKSSDVKYCICRLGAVLPSTGKFDINTLPETFNMNLEGRVEIVSDLDVATAISNAAERLMAGDDIHGKIFNIGGGKEKGFQRYGRDLTIGLFEKMGIGKLNPDCFTKKEYFLDWMDTEESQAFLNFQNHTYEETLNLILGPVKKYRPIVLLFSPIIRRFLESKSPYFSKS